MPDLGWSRHVTAWEAAEWGPCFEAAEKNGIAPRDAEECDDFDKGCVDCPWKDEWPKTNCSSK